MAVYRWGHALEAFRDLEREMDRLLRRVSLPLYGPRFGNPYPPVNILETDESYLLLASIAGTDLDSLDVSVAGGRLTIRGVRSRDERAKEEDFRRSERLVGEWERSFTLPDRIRDDEMRADMQNGILMITLPKAPSAEPRQIPVSDSEN